MDRVQYDGGRVREITGRTVLIWLLVFFGIVMAVNFVMMRAATMTFGGLETASSYQAGLAFNSERATALDQAQRHWNVTAHVARSASDEAAVSVSVRDRDGRLLKNIAMQARLIHPADARHDHGFDMQETSPGEFRGVTLAESGQWDLQIDILRADERLFRSRSRIHVE
jgi:nitrogen fixation protein FixH